MSNKNDQPIADDMTQKNAAIFALHRYWIWSNILRMKFGSNLMSTAQDLKKREWFISDNAIFMSYWYTSLFVVVEGYKELRLCDPVIDELLDSELVDCLRLYRHGTVHFQKNYFDHRFSELIFRAESASWINQLSSELGRFLIEELNKLGLQPE